MLQETAYTQLLGAKQAINDIQSQLHNTSYNLLIFFASAVYDFSELTSEFQRLYPDTHIVGVSSAGELSKNGFCKRGLLVTTMQDSDILLSPVLIDNINKYPIIHKAKIEQALNECKIDLAEEDFHTHSFALTFINGLLNLEEYFLSMVYGIVGNRNFRLIGATAGDDHRYLETKVSLNGTISTHGAVIIFINTKKRFKLYKENLFKPTGHKLHITKCDMQNRKILEINHKPPLTAYAEELGVSSTTLIERMYDHPLGRTFGHDMYITSLDAFNADKTLNMHTRVINNSILDVLMPDDFVSICENSCKKIKKDFGRPGFLLFFNCICNTLSYERWHCCDSISTICNQYFDHYCGLSSYGEQINQIHVSQTMLVLAMEE